MPISSTKSRNHYFSPGSTRPVKEMVFLSCLRKLRWRNVLLMVILIFAAELQPRSESQEVLIESDISSAQQQMQKGNFGKALTVLESITKKTSAPPPEVFILMATCYQNLNQTPQALSACEQAMSLYPREAVLEDFYVTMLRRFAPRKIMQEKLELALVANPRSLNLLCGLVSVQLEMDPHGGRTKESAQQLMDSHPEDPNSHYLFGQWAVQNAQKETAIAEWKKSLALAKVSSKMEVDVYTLIGDTEDHLNHPDLAEKAFQKALQVNVRMAPHNPASAYFYAEFLSNRSRMEESQKIISLILSWTGDYGPARLARALYLSRQHNVAGAIAEANLALKGAGNNPEQIRAIHALLAKSYFATKRMEEAKVHQEWLETH